MALIILDCDGVINQQPDDFIKSPDEWLPIAGSLAAIARLTQHGYQVVVVTNQAGIGLKLLTIDVLNAIYIKMNAQLSQYGGVIDAIFFCPHKPTDDCRCRKPKPGLYNQVSERLRISLSKVYCVGDKMTDVTAAQSAGAKPVLVCTGHGQREINEGNVPQGIPVHADLATFVHSIIH